MINMFVAGANSMMAYVMFTTESPGLGWLNLALAVLNVVLAFSV